MIPESSESLLDEVASDEQVLPHSAGVLEDKKNHQKKFRSVLRKKAMDLLARREHAVGEMQQKLQTYARKRREKQREDGRDDANDAEIVSGVVAVLQSEGLLSDERFTEAFVRYRSNNGYGPMRIQMELRERGVNEKIQHAYLDFADSRWAERVAQVRRKRFGKGLPADYKERARQARFLQYRGFTTDQINHALAGGDYD